MGQSEEQGAKGSMILRRRSTESASGHVETNDDLSLEATPDGKGVILVAAQGITNFYKSHQSHHKETRTMITVDELVELIRAKGKNVN